MTSLFSVPPTFFFFLSDRSSSTFTTLKAGNWADIAVERGFVLGCMNQLKKGNSIRLRDSFLITFLKIYTIPVTFGSICVLTANRVERMLGKEV